jgi:hypothetical protein
MLNFYKQLEDLVAELENDSASTAPGEKFTQDLANVLLQRKEEVK